MLFSENARIQMSTSVKYPMNIVYFSIADLSNTMYLLNYVNYINYFTMVIRYIVLY